jgi:hypothetical protein
VYSEVYNALSLLLTSLLIALAYIQAPVNRVCDVVIDEALKVREGIGKKRSCTVGVAL